MNQAKPGGASVWGASTLQKPAPPTALRGLSLPRQLLGHRVPGTEFRFSKGCGRKVLPLRPPATPVTTASPGPTSGRNGRLDRAGGAPQEDPKGFCRQHPPVTLSESGPRGRLRPAALLVQPRGGTSGRRKNLVGCAKRPRASRQGSGPMMCSDVFHSCANKAGGGAYEENSRKGNTGPGCQIFTFLGPFSVPPPGLLYFLVLLTWLIFAILLHQMLDVRQLSTKP